MDELAIVGASDKWEAADQGGLRQNPVGRAEYLVARFCVDEQLAVEGAVR